MNKHTKQIWATLIQAGLVHGPVPVNDDSESPWYVKVLLAFSGWLAAVFMLGFIGAGFKFIINSSPAAFTTGSIMVGVAFAIFRMQKNEFFDHLALAVSLAGQALIVFALFKFAGNDHESVWIMVALIQAPLAVFMPNFIHRVFSSFFSAFSFYMALVSMSAPFVFTGVIMLLASLLWLNEFRYPHNMHIIRSIGYGLILALIQLTSSEMFGLGIMKSMYSGNQSELWIQPWMGNVLTGAVTIYVVWELLQRSGRDISERFTITVLLGTLLLCAVSFEAHGITAGIVIMLLGFSSGNRVLLGLGILSLLFYISSYYYLLDTTLLIKALTLFVLSMVLFSIRWLILRTMPKEKEWGRV